MTDPVEAIAEEILDAFATRNVPAALAQIFIHRDDDRPSLRWSATNQFLAVLHGHPDARGFRQWQSVGRSVRKGERAFRILGPRTRKATANDVEEGFAQEVGESVLCGFVAIPVFTYLQTEGEPLPTNDQEAGFLERLPFLEVARSWELDVSTFDGRYGSALGAYRHGLAITLGVENFSTWAHELVHAADDRLDTLDTSTPERKAASEVVAELGGAVLLECVGQTVASDRGGALDYIEHWTETTGQDTVRACTVLIDRIVACVRLILQTAGSLDEERAAA